ncbi:glutamine amidotransferase [Undibacterium sp. Tian12W]|uniref:glutamine amidotransferase n=1 Tax=Undibacterium sp. Tian12W TaxID=3413054 RepID=UPI003BF2E585
MKTALIIHHVAFEDAGSFLALLKEQDFNIQEVNACTQGWAALDPLAADVCIVLGGPIGAYEDDNYPFLLREVYFLQQRLHADLPTLGICLGAQIMARALGASVYPAAAKEIGWFPLKVTNEGKDTPVRHFDARHCNMFHWHGDTFDLPQGAQLLASSEACHNQAYGWGKHGLAFQCHPEVTAAGLEAWFVGNAYEMAHEKLSIPQTRQQAASNTLDLAHQARLFFTEWLSVCGV